MCSRLDTHQLPSSPQWTHHGVLSGLRSPDGDIDSSRCCVRGSRKTLHGFTSVWLGLYSGDICTLSAAMFIVPGWGMLHHIPWVLQYRVTFWCLCSIRIYVLYTVLLSWGYVTSNHVWIGCAMVTNSYTVLYIFLARSTWPSHSLEFHRTKWRVCITNSRHTVQLPQHDFVYAKMSYLVSVTGCCEIKDSKRSLCLCHSHAAVV